MGLAKASAGGQRALSGGRAWGGRGVRVNGISAGPIKTLAASGIKDFGKLLDRALPATTPIRRTITIDDVGNTAAFLLSDLSGGISAEIVYVDGGFSHVAIGRSRGLTALTCSRLAKQPSRAVRGRVEQHSRKPVRRAAQA